jgi:hypothetical protein
MRARRSPRPLRHLTQGDGRRERCVIGDWVQFLAAELVVGRSLQQDRKF